MRRSLLLVFISMLPSLLIAAGPRIIVTEATYIMGDGETPSFAEIMALQKAKQVALEQAGTYLQSVTTVQNYRLTSDEIQTLAGGLIKVEVLEKKRTIVDDGVRVWIKIQAVVDADQVQVLADRVKGKTVAADYKKLQDDYIQLGQDIEKWRQLVAKAPAARERDVALEQMQEQQKKLARLQQQEATLIQRIVSGETLAAKAGDQLTRQLRELGALNALLQQILDRGHLLTIGEPTIETSLREPQLVTVHVPVAVEVNPTMQEEILQLASANGWETDKFNGPAYQKGIAVRPGTDLEVLAAFQRALRSYSLMIKFVLRDGERACVDMTRFALAQAGKLSVIPDIDMRYGYAPVAGLIQDPYDPKSKVRMAIFGISPSFGWSKEEVAARAAALRFIRREDSAPGFIGIINRGRRFDISLKMPFDIAKTITAVRGVFQKDLNPPPPAFLLPHSDVEPCMVVEK